MYLLLSSCPNFFGKIKIQYDYPGLRGRFSKIRNRPNAFELELISFNSSEEMGSDQRLGSSKEKIIKPNKWNTQTFSLEFIETHSKLDDFESEYKQK